MADVPGALNDPLIALRSATSARVGLGRAGQGLPTAPMLAFQLAHARARDAVTTPLDVEKVRVAIGRSQTVVVDSAAATRADYLQHPDLGRRLGEDSSVLVKGDYDVAFIIADGLSATAVHAHAANLTRGLLDRLPDWSVAPLVIARQARVAIGDPIGQALGARLVVVLIGERPGLSAADSLSAYITWDPKPGRRDSERNCVSNIRSPGGLEPRQAADKIIWLMGEAKRLGFSGVALKDRQTIALRGDEDGRPLLT
jgi:ethanolamine ammonia-lyase small subunit